VPVARLENASVERLGDLREVQRVDSDTVRDAAKGMTNDDPTLAP
jgi:hypothetical protein